MKAFFLITASLRDFARKTDGAITVDWIVLTAAAGLLGLGTAFLVAASVPDVADKVSSYMSDMEVGGGTSDADTESN